MLPSSLGPKSSEMYRKTVEMCSLVRRVHISVCFLEKCTSDSTSQRWKRPSRLLPTKRLLFPGTPCLFQQDNARPLSAWVTTVCLHRHRVCVLDWPACSPYLSPIENVWCIMKRRIRQRWPRTVELLESYIHQEWAKTPLAKLQKLISSVSKRLQSVIQRNYKHACHNFLCVADIPVHFEICLYLTNRIKLISENTENIFFCPFVCKINVQVNEQITDFTFYCIFYFQLLWKCSLYFI